MLALGPAPVAAQHAVPRSESAWIARARLSAMVTYQWGGSVSTTAGRLSFDDSENFAAVLTLPVRPGARAELYYSYQPTTLRRDQNSGVPQELAPIRIHYFQLGGRFEPVRDGRFRPHFSGTAGAALFDGGRNASGIDYGSDLAFAFRFAAGATAVLTRRVGLRAELGLFVPIFWSGGAFVCGGGGCTGVITGSITGVQGTVGGGVTIAL